MYSLLTGARVSMLRTVDWCPACFMSAFALHTWTDIPPCGGGYGPAKSTFINESPAPQPERDQPPELPIPGEPSIVHFARAFDIRVAENNPFDARSREQQVADQRGQLTAHH